MSDTYRIAARLSEQSDVTVIEVEDYIANPKPNGYKGLHMIVEIPVRLSDRVEQVPVEVQIRTIAQDFWPPGAQDLRQVPACDTGPTARHVDPRRQPTRYEDGAAAHRGYQALGGVGC